jgi:hypothetical protein
MAKWRLVRFSLSLYTIETIAQTFRWCGASSKTGAALNPRDQGLRGFWVMPRAGAALRRAGARAAQKNISYGRGGPGSVV